MGPITVLLAGMLLALTSCSAPPNANDDARVHDQRQPIERPIVQPVEQPIGGTVHSIRLVPVTLTIDHDDGTAERRTLWFSTTLITWDLFDVFVYGLDQPDSEGNEDQVDAVTRPTRPYIALDRGFGRAGYPAISMSHQNAEAFCQWLTQKTGRRYRLPTEEEWRAACASSQVDHDAIDAFAWHAGNSGGTTHPVGRKRADANGLYDLLGNAAEWVTKRDGRGVALGGSYLTPREQISCLAQDEPTREWNASDPQFPPSPWWYADAGFVGFRIVLEEFPANGHETTGSIQHEGADEHVR